MALGANEKCGDCAKLVLDMDKGLQCEACKKWFHSKCQNMDEETYKLIGQDCIHWFCKSCDRVVAKLFKTVVNLMVRQYKIEGVLDQAVKDIDTVKAEVAKVTNLTKKLDTKLEIIIEAKLA